MSALFSTCTKLAGRIVHQEDCSSGGSHHYGVGPTHIFNAPFFEIPLDVPVTTLKLVQRHGPVSIVFEDPPFILDLKRGA
jgi:hypothetical protein